MKADQGAQFIDDIGISANFPDQLITNLGAVFECFQKAVLNLCMAKCHFEEKESISWDEPFNQMASPQRNERLQNLWK